MKCAIRPVILMSLLISGAWLGAFCSKNPTEPYRPTGVRLYLGEATTNNLYALNAVTNAVLDSIPNILPIDMVVSRDGSWLYVLHYLHGVNQGTVKIDASSFAIAAELPKFGFKIAFLEHEHFLVRQGTWYLDFIDPVSFKILKTDSIPLTTFAATDSADFIVGAHRELGMVSYDYGRKEILFSDNENFTGAHYLTLHPSGTAGYGIYTGNVGWFVAYEVPSLDVNYRYPLSSHDGQCAPSPDGRYVLITDPGPMHRYVLGVLHVYEVSSNEVIKTVSTDTLALADSVRRALTQIEYSPDGTSAYIAPGLYGAWNGPVLVFDMDKLEFIDRIMLAPDFEPTVSDIAVGPRP